MSFNQASNIAPVVNHQSNTSMYSRGNVDVMQSSFHQKQPGPEDNRQSFDQDPNASSQKVDFGVEDVDQKKQTSNFEGANEFGVGQGNNARDSVDQINDTGSNEMVSGDI